VINNNTILNDYGINIKKRIIEIGITQRELASMVGIDEKHLSKIVRGVKKGWKYRDKIDEVLKNTKSKSVV